MNQQSDVTVCQFVVILPPGGQTSVTAALTDAHLVNRQAGNCLRPQAIRGPLRAVSKYGNRSDCNPLPLKQPMNDLQ